MGKMPLYGPENPYYRNPRGIPDNPNPVRILESVPARRGRQTTTTTCTNIIIHKCHPLRGFGIRNISRPDNTTQTSYQKQGRYSITTIVSIFSLQMTFIHLCSLLQGKHEPPGKPGLPKGFFYRKAPVLNFH